MIVLPFSDDSTLIFACAMRRLLQACPEAPPVALWRYTAEDALSARQMAQMLPEGPDHVASHADLAGLLTRTDVSAVVTCRMYLALSDGLQDVAGRLRRPRPCVVAFQGGLEFFPETSYLRRRWADAAFLLPRDAPLAFNACMDARGMDIRPGTLGFGHPAFLHPGVQATGDTGGDIVFYAQAISPLTRKSRMHMVQVLAAIARRNPHRRVWIKLRHLPDENTRHLHRERHDYPALLAGLRDAPPNLGVRACAMHEALVLTGVGITCTSTAAADLISAGLPCMVHLDYVDHYRDPLVAPMRRLFAHSGLIADLEDLLNLRARGPDPGWLADLFCPPDLAVRVLDIIAAHHAIAD